MSFARPFRHRFHSFKYEYAEKACVREKHDGKKSFNLTLSEKSRMGMASIKR
jgi:hypothetical protein